MDEEIKIPNNIEIDKALKEFEMQSNTGQSQQIISKSKASEVPRMVGWVIKLSGGAIKDQKQAEYVLLGLAVLMFLASLFFFFHK